MRAAPRPPVRYRTAVRVPGRARRVSSHSSWDGTPLEARCARTRRHAGQGHPQATEAHAGLLVKCRSVGVVGQLSVCAVLRRVAARAAILPIWAARAWSSGATLLLSALAEGGQRRRGRIGHLLGDKPDGPAQSRWGRRRCRVRRVVGDSAETPSPQGAGLTDWGPATASGRSAPTRSERTGRRRRLGP